MATSKTSAAREAASEITNVNLDAVAARFLAWIDEHEDTGIAADALLAAGGTKNPATLLVRAQANYDAAITAGDSGGSGGSVSWGTTGLDFGTFRHTSSAPLSEAGSAALDVAAINGRAWIDDVSQDLAPLGASGTHKVVKILKAGLYKISAVVQMVDISEDGQGWTENLGTLGAQVTQCRDGSPYSTLFDISMPTGEGTNYAESDRTPEKLLTLAAGDLLTAVVQPYFVLPEGRTYEWRVNVDIARVVSDG